MIGRIFWFDLSGASFPMLFTLWEIDRHPSSNMSNCTILYRIVLHCTVLYYVAQCRIILYCIKLLQNSALKFQHFIVTHHAIVSQTLHFMILYTKHCIPCIVSHAFYYLHCISLKRVYCKEQTCKVLNYLII